MSDIEVLHPDHPKVYARWAVIIGGGKSPIKWVKKPPTILKSTAKLSHIANSCPPRIVYDGEVLLMLLFILQEIQRRKLNVQGQV